MKFVIPITEVKEPSCLQTAYENHTTLLAHILIARRSLKLAHIHFPYSQECLKIFTSDTVTVSYSFLLNICSMNFITISTMILGAPLIDHVIINSLIAIS